MEKYNETNATKEHKAIIVHAINTENDFAGLGLLETPVLPNGPGGNDGCIAFNRANFIKYCEDNNVQMM
ncbi:MAG TPA: hypothetical protein EYP22_07580 [Methanosarcinales archaeon]|nr:hypothetical protein [Methanosarcinales archaeon]